ncbi:ribonuclease H-like domain-containing protein [Tanacetum coccineum]
MSLHNSIHNSDHGDDYIEDPGRVTLISKLDISDPLYLHPNDSTATVILVKLKGTKNYQVWSCAMLLALKGKNKTGFINGSCKRSNIYEVLGRQRDRVNAFIFEELFLGQTFQKGQNMFGKNLKKLMISFILSREVLPDVRTAYATISCEESHRVASGNIVGSSQRDSAFVSNISSSSGFIDEQMATLIFLIKDNKNEKNVQAHMAGQLYDVLVIPEYCVTLISVPRLAKENKVVVAFDESRCYFLNKEKCYGDW